MAKEFSCGNEYGDAIAVIGMAARFPGAESIDEFWKNLCGGIECVSFFTPEELREQGVGEETIRDPSYVPVKGVIPGVEMFDAGFFNINPREAEITDPQHRIFLETAWHALEHGGYDPDRFDGKVGVFAGAAINPYLGQLYRNPKLLSQLANLEALMAMDKDFIATRFSYKANLRGPSVNVQSACSTTLVAVHLACQSILSGESDMALAGGISVFLPERSGYFYQPGGVNSPDGHCRSFDARAEGTVWGDGIGVFLLKRYLDAVEDGDTIHAIIRGSAINNDGAQKTGYSAPSVEGQTAVVLEALSVSGVSAESIGYVEAHATGTAVGDPIEVAALTKAFRHHTERKEYCAIGAVKPNIGHLNTAAGAASLVKAILAVKHGKIPPTINFTEPNPSIPFADSPFFVNTELLTWRGDGPRRAGVSAFGVGGTNAHIVVEAPPCPLPAWGEPEMPQVLVISARSAAALAEVGKRTAIDLQSPNQDISLAAAAFTLQHGRRAQRYRAAAVASSHSEAAGKLISAASRAVVAKTKAAGTLAFLFPGQGSQYIGMAKNLLEREPVFASEFQKLASQLQAEFGLRLFDILYPPSEDEGGTAGSLTNTAVAQPALFSLEYALARLWNHYGVVPSAMLGHSVGEYTAACLAGVMDSETALRIVAMRGRLVASLPPGSMVTVGLPLSETEKLLLDHPGLDIGAVNAPELTTVAGPEGEIQEFISRLVDEDVLHKPVRTSHAFHSRILEGVLPEFLKVFDGVHLNPPKIPFISTVTGQWITAEQACNPEYWVKQLRGTVLFSPGLQTIVSSGSEYLLEVGPGRSLTQLIRQHRLSREVTSFGSLPAPGGTSNDHAIFLQSAAALWCHGIPISWPPGPPGGTMRRVPLSGYPYERTRFSPQPGYRGKISTDRDNQSPPAVRQQKAYVQSWQKQRAPSNSGLKGRLCWLIRDGSPFSERFSLELRQQGARIVEFLDGNGLTAQKGEAILPHDQPDEYREILRQAWSEIGAPEVIYHALNCGPVCYPSNGPAALKHNELLSLVLLAQAIEPFAASAKTTLIVLSEGTLQVFDQEPVSPSRSLLLGAVRVIPQEMPNVRVRLLDYPLSGSDGNGDMDVQYALDENGSHGSGVAAIRGATRWTEVFVESALVAPPECGYWRGGGIYLITGGLGGIGLSFARAIAQTAPAKIVLVARSAFPEPQQWETWQVSHAEDDPIARKMRELKAIVALGSEIKIVSADVCSEEQMALLRDTIQKEFGTVTGVIHAAGTIASTMTGEKTPDNMGQVLAPKVEGTEIVGQFFGGPDLEFFLLCSSISAACGGIRLLDYASANAYLDAYATARRLEGWPVVSIGWDAWRDVGMLAGAATSTNRGHRDLAESGLFPEEAVQFASRVAACNAANVIVSRRLPNEWSCIDATVSKPGISPVENERQAHPRPDLSTEYTAPRTQMEKQLAKIWADVLQLAEVGIHDDFFELGGHSLLGISLIARVNDIGIKLLIKDLFDFPSIAMLAAEADNLAEEATPEPIQDSATDDFDIGFREAFAQWRGISRIDGGDPLEGFFTMDHDWVSLATFLREQYIVEFPLPLVRANRTVAELAQCIRQHLAEVIATLPDDEVNALLEKLSR